MRLIDADEIEYFTMNIVGENSFKGNHNVISQFYIDKMPTVEAIPIEYIEKVRDAIKVNSEVPLLVIYSEILTNLINNWRKENDL